MAVNLEKLDQGINSNTLPDVSVSALEKAIAPRVRQGKRFLRASATTWFIFALGLLVLYLIRPELAGPLTHTIAPTGTTPASAMQALAAVLAGPVGVGLAVSAMLVSMALGIAQSSIAPMLPGLAMAGMVFIGPSVLSPIVGSNSHSSTSDTALIQASRLAVQGSRHPLTLAQQKELAADIQTFQASQERAVPNHKFSPEALRRLEYRLSLPLAPTARPALASAYVQHIQQEQQVGDELHALFTGLEILSLLVFSGSGFYVQRHKATLRQVRTMLG